MKKDNLSKGEVIIYKDKTGPKLEVKLREETVWLTQQQMSLLFGKVVSTINEHIKNVYREKELDEKPTIRKFRIVQKEGGRRIERELEFYNLDVIISVGYRVKSLQGTRFRIWATRTLKEHIIKGYTINQKRLLKQTENLKELQKAIVLLGEKSRHKLLAAQAPEILNLLAEYAKSISVLEQYDSRSLALLQEKKPSFVLTYETCLELIARIKTELTAKKQASNLFGREVDRKFESVIKNLYQTFGRRQLYGSLEEKAAHLLYLTIKDHPFVDGNKRIGSLLFIYFLQRNRYLLKPGGERKINDNTLVALSLLIAVSEPKEKEVMIKIITNLLK